MKRGLSAEGMVGHIPEAVVGQSAGAPVVSRAETPPLHCTNHSKESSLDGEESINTPTCANFRRVPQGAASVQNGSRKLKENGIGRDMSMGCNQLAQVAYFYVPPDNGSHRRPILENHRDGE